MRAAAAWVALAVAAGGCAKSGTVPPGRDGGRRDGGADGGIDDGAVRPADGGSCATDDDCNDLRTCTGVERCAGGGCVPGEAIVCDDGIECTVDPCVEPTGGCTSEPDSRRCPDGQVCHRTMGCRAATPCTTDPDCDDGAGCNGTERCMPGAVGSDPLTGCAAGAPVRCDDGLACTADACLEPGGRCSNVAPDADRDGHPVAGCAGGTDCDDTRASVHPGATDVCNGLDDDCAGGRDDGPGLDCAMGSPPEGCTSGCGTAGSRACNACVRAACTASEVCNVCDDDGDGACDDGIGCRTGVHRSYHGATREHFYTTDRSEAACCGFTVEAYDNFFVHSSPMGSLDPLYRCLLAGGFHFYTRSSTCEGAPGAMNEGALGHVARSAGVCGSTELYRLWLPGNGDHLYTTSAAERDMADAGGYVYEGVEGYVWLSP